MTQAFDGKLPEQLENSGGDSDDDDDNDEDDGQEEEDNTTDDTDNGTGVRLIIIYLSIRRPSNCMFSGHLIQNALSNWAQLFKASLA